VNNKELADRAKELEQQLRQKVAIYLVVGWMRRDDGMEIFIVYYDKRVGLAERDVPHNWYGCPVIGQGILPPGAEPEEILDIPW
jgi:hypothetical protein